MNRENLKYLQANLEYLGFGKTLHASLENCIEFGLPRFRMTLDVKIPMPNPKNRPDCFDIVQYQLEIAKESDTDNYAFDRYDVYLRPAIRPYEMFNHRFYIHQGEGITVNESYNLLSGRALNKDVILKNGEKANMWLKLDFARRDGEIGYDINCYSKNYGFDVADIIGKFMVQDIDKPGFQEQLLKSLERGSLHEVVFFSKGNQVAGFVTANPQFKTLDFYDRCLNSIQSQLIDRRAVPTKAWTAAENMEAIREEASIEAKKGRGR
jgi:hypothetical protein